MRKVGLFLFFFLFYSSAYGEQVVVFRSNLNYKVGTPYQKPQFFRIPSIVTVNSNGYLVAFAEERLGSNADEGDINVVYKYSYNHGRTWSRMYRLCELGKDTCGNPSPVVDQNTGRIHVFMNGNKGFKKQGVKTGERAFRPGDRWTLYSSGVFKNNHLEFGPIKDLTKKLLPENFTWDAVGPGVGIQLATGPKKGRLIVPAKQRTFYSDDGGESWHMSNLDPDNKGTETTIAEIGLSGTIFRSERTHGLYKVPEGKPRSRLTSLSFDGGYSFTDAKLDHTLVDPYCQGSLLRYTSSRIIHANCGHSEKRRHLTLRMTNDGKTWLQSKELNYDCGYSSMTKTKDYKIAILWEKKASAEVRKVNVERARSGKDLVLDRYSLKDLGFQEIPPQPEFDDSKNFWSIMQSFF